MAGYRTLRGVKDAYTHDLRVTTFGCCIYRGNVGSMTRVAWQDLLIKPMTE